MNSLYARFSSRVAKTTTTQRPRFIPMKILLLEKTPKSARETLETLRKLDVSATVEWCSSVDDALASLRASKGAPFSALLFDLSTDVEGAGGIIARATRLDVLGKTAVIAISDSNSNQCRATALARDAQGFLPKPLDPKRLQEMLTKRRLYWELRELPTRLDEY